MNSLPFSLLTPHKLSSLWRRGEKRFDQLRKWRRLSSKLSTHLPEVAQLFEVSTRKFLFVKRETFLSVSKKVEKSEKKSTQSLGFLIYEFTVVSHNSSYSLPKVTLIQQQIAFGCVFSSCPTRISDRQTYIIRSWSDINIIKSVISQKSFVHQQTQQSLMIPSRCHKLWSFITSTHWCWRLMADGARRVESYGPFLASSVNVSRANGKRSTKEKWEHKTFKFMCFLPPKAAETPTKEC